MVAMFSFFILISNRCYDITKSMNELFTVLFKKIAIKKDYLIERSIQ